MSRARQQVEIDAPPAVVLDVICDFGAYPAFLPWLRQVEVVRHERAGPGQPRPAWEVRFHLDLIRPLQYTLRLEQDPAGDDGSLGLRWSLVEGAFRANDGSWSLAPLGDGTRTRAIYEIELQTGAWVPTYVMRSIEGRDLPALLDRFRAEAERRYRGA
ncbi:SRPBCC family protein [Myxococcota bacterium]|nr:SRPBCC family protein [Myxococcota bacterium]